MLRKKTVVLITAAAGVAAATLVFFGVRHWRPRLSVVQGAVIRSDSDPRKQLPIAGVEIIARYGDSSLATESDASGYFQIAIPGTVLPGQTVLLSFRQPGYKDLNLPVIIRLRSSLRELIVAAMLPTGGEAGAGPAIARTGVSNIRVRYTENSETEENIGSEAKTFEIANRGNVPCRHRSPCSPDRYWKASTGSMQLDAGAGNEFREARASCIAGPCPFTRIDAHGFAQGGRMITATALDWSDTATFLLQAEVYRTSIVSEVRESYPVIYGRGLNFTLPPTAEGVCLVAELGGVEIVFPLGPDLDLSWATCTVMSAKNQPNSVYQCELKPGYKF